MRKSFKVSAMAVLAAVMALMAGTAYAVSPSDFDFGVTSQIWDFMQSGEYNLTKLGEMAEETIICQGANSIAVERTRGGDGYYAFFKTRDTKITFPGNIRVGGSLKSVIDGKEIPGQMTQLKELPKGQQACQWNILENILFTIYAKEDVIHEIVFFNPEIEVETNVNELQYLQRAHYDLDNMIGVRFPVDFSSKGMVLGKGNAWSFPAALEGDSELIYAFQEEPFNLEDYEPTDLVTDVEKGFSVGMTKSSAYLWITDSEKYFDFEGGQGYVSIEIYGDTREQIKHWYEALKNGAVEIFSLDGMDTTERNADEAMSGLS
jgi:hypothetical protein